MVWVEQWERVRVSSVYVCVCVCMLGGVTSLEFVGGYIVVSKGLVNKPIIKNG